MSIAFFLLYAFSLLLLVFYLGVFHLHETKIISLKVHIIFHKRKMVDLQQSITEIHNSNAPARI